MSILHRGEEQIRKAMEDGQFDNLPGKGKPLKLDDNPFEDPEWRQANKILQDNGFTLPWIEKAQEIDQRLEKARHDLKIAWEWRCSKQPVQSNMDTEWKRAEGRFRDEIAEINKLIFSYNLEAPNMQLQRFMLNADKEILEISTILGES
jgi:DnaJ family protein C protein 28